MHLDVPIALFIFNRPELTRQVFESIRRQKPSRLLIVGDGPRHNVEGEAELVEQSRDIATQVDWDCDWQAQFSEVNLGCRKRMASGISWAFEQCESLIILEDDCLPDDSFYGYCSELLARYRNCPEVMMISGDCFQPQQRTPYSYYFSRWAHIWGWASWRRAWEQYDLELKDWPQEKHIVPHMFDSDAQRDHWQALYDRVADGKLDTWDFSWQYTIQKAGGLVVLPETNLISNIGFGHQATHTTDPESRLANLPTSSLSKLKHPPTIQRNQTADQWTFDNIFRPLEEPVAPPPSKPRWWRRRPWKKSRRAS